MAASDDPHKPEIEAKPSNGVHDSTTCVPYQEIVYRRSKQWDIFSWCSTILVTITGGLILLQTAQPPRPLQPGQKRIITFAVIVLSTYAFLWIGHHWRREESARKCFTKKVRDEVWKSPSLNPAAGHRGALVLLCLAALLATWYPWPFAH